MLHTTEHKLIYSIRTLDGRKIIVEAWDADEACALADITRADCKRWYPLPLKIVLSEEEKAEMAARFAQLRTARAERQIVCAPKPRSAIVAKAWATRRARQMERRAA